MLNPLTIVDLIDSLVRDPLFDALGVEPDELADLVERHSTFVDEAPHKVLSHSKVHSEGRSVDQVPSSASIGHTDPRHARHASRRSTIHR